MGFKFNPIEGQFDLVNKGLRDLINGSIKESFNALCTSDGATVTMSLEQVGGGDLTLQFSDETDVLDCTPAQTIALTPGADDAPQENYVYIPKTTKVLTVSTSNFPTTEHIKIAYFFVPSALHVQDEGCYINQNWNDHLKGTDEMGHLLHIAEHIRRSGAKYFSGIDPNGSDQDTNTSYFDYVGAMEAYFKSGAGVIYQVHEHTMPAVDTSISGDDIHVINWDGDNYHEISNLADITTDSTGTSLSNSYFNVFFFAVGNKTGEYAPTMCVLPSGSYSSQTSAENDVDGYDNLQMPREFALESSTGTPICRMTLRWTGGLNALSHISTVDLRTGGQVASGGTTGTTTSFADNQFEVFNVADNTKLLEFDLSGLTPSNTSSLTIPDKDGTIALLDDITALDSTYLKLDTTNGPLTGDLSINKITPSLSLVDSTNDYTAVLYKEDTLNEFRVTNKVFVTPAGGGASTLSDNLISYWDFDSNGSLPDEVGTSPGTLTGTTFNASGKIAGSFIFNGTTDKIRISNEAPFAFGTGSCTFSMWFKTTQSSGNLQMISANWASGTAAGLDMNNGQVRGLFLTGSGTTIPISPLSYADGNWHLAVGVVDKTAGLNRIYVDGDEKATAPTHGGSLTSTVDYGIGDGMGSGNGFRGLEWPGELDEAGVWDRALTPAEVTELYNGGAGKAHPFSGGGGGPTIETSEIISSIDGVDDDERGILTLGDDEGRVIVQAGTGIDLTTGADLAQLSTQPTGTVDLAIATTKYVNDNLSDNSIPATCTASESVGDIVYVTSDNTVAQADASAISTAKAVGIIFSKADTTNCTVQIGGLVDSLSGLTAGDVYFVSETSGQITNTVPTTSGSVINPIGVALSATELLLNIGHTYTVRS